MTRDDLADRIDRYRQLAREAIAKGDNFSRQVTNTLLRDAAFDIANQISKNPTAVVCRTRDVAWLRVLIPHARFFSPGQAMTGYGFKLIIIILTPPDTDSRLEREAEAEWFRHLPTKLLHGGQIVHLGETLAAFDPMAPMRGRSEPDAG